MADQDLTGFGLRVIPVSVKLCQGVLKDGNLLSNDTPCFSTLATALAGSHSKVGASMSAR